MRLSALLLAIMLISFSLQSYLLKQKAQVLEQFRPKEIEPGKEEKGSINLFASLIKLTAFLIFLKLIGFKLEYIVDLAVFLSSFYLGLLLGFPELGFIALAFRKVKEVELFNISSLIAIISFDLLLAPFLTPKAVFLLMALLSLYDVIGVLYFPYIKFLWLQVSKERIMQGIAVISEDGTMGAGDLALPLLLFLSHKSLLAFLYFPFFLIAFEANKVYAKLFGPMPGLPLITALAFIPFLFLSF